MPTIKRPCRVIPAESRHAARHRHIRQYDSYPANIFVAQDIIQSPVPGEPEMLRTGHHGNLFEATPPDMSLGDYSLVLHMQSATENDYSYRFYKNNMIVIVDLRGFHPFVTEENVYRLAKIIYDKLPEEFPVAEQINTPSLELQPELAEKYFYTLEMTTCQPPYEATDPVIETELGYCFRADIISLIRNLKVGLYDEHYRKVIYMKEFLTMPQLGEWDTGFFFPVWGYSWQHFTKEITARCSGWMTNWRLLFHSHILNNHHNLTNTRRITCHTKSKYPKRPHSR